MIWLDSSIAIFVGSSLPIDFCFRDFISQHYVALKKVNPNTPILIRECSNVEPKIFARYGKFCFLFPNFISILVDYSEYNLVSDLGKEKKAVVANENSESILKQIKALASSS